MRQRPAARLIVMNHQNRVLLFRFVVPRDAPELEIFWATPGGALHPGETYQQAARRELLEETGITADLGEIIARRRAVFRTPSGEMVTADERYFLIHVSSVVIDEAGQQPEEARTMSSHRWWSQAELREAPETFYPEDLLRIARFPADC